MASKLVRTIGWFVVGDAALILFLIAFGLLIHAMKIPAQGFFKDTLSIHGPFFGFLLPLALYSLIPAVLIWFIAWGVVGVMEERRKHRTKKNPPAISASLMRLK
jgi:hypothetical protein